MTRTTPSGPLRLISWNGLQFSLPISWEVMVSGPRHLLIECNFRPVAEIRWDASGKGDLEGVVKTVGRRLATGGEPIERVAVPELFAALNGGRGVVGLGRQTGNRLDGLVWQCRESGALLFCRLYLQHAEPNQVAQLLASLSCSHEDNAPATWTIQDFRLTLPQGFRFVDSTFAAGLTRLAFQGHGMNIQFCRLAPASSRLEHQSPAQLLASLMDRHQPMEIIRDTPDLHECRNHPSTLHRIRQRLRRKLPYLWGRIWHDERHNRLLSLTAAGPRTIDLAFVDGLCANYEIIPKD